MFAIIHRNHDRGIIWSHALDRVLLPVYNDFGLLGDCLPVGRGLSSKSRSVSSDTTRLLMVTFH